jgi:hypothetical protein
MQYVFAQPQRTAPRALSHGAQRQLLVVVIEHFVAVVTSVPETIQTHYQLGQIITVHALTWKHPESTGGGHALFKTWCCTKKIRDGSRSSIASKGVLAAKI